mmetsp:Transcript_8880/g.19666  ORF Transcript_8880/g.19666 Transcript_8880/m.19666 type:complete len:247 (+) Transcript_8880:3-743(+)
MLVARVFSRRWHDVANKGRLGCAAAATDGNVPSILSLYAYMLRQHPFKCAAVAATSAAAFGDAIAQLLACGARQYELFCTGFVETRESYSWALPSLTRCTVYATVVGSIVGVGGELWYRQLLRHFPGWTYDVALRTVLDQGFFAPVALGLVVAASALFQSADASYTRRRLSDIGLHPMGPMWTWWSVGVAVSYLNVRPPYQPLVAFVWAVAWNAYISAIIHAPGPEHMHAERAVAAFIRGERCWDE